MKENSIGLNYIIHIDMIHLVMKVII